MNPTIIHHLLPPYWEDAKKAPLVLLDECIDEFKMYVHVTYNLNVDDLVTTLEYDGDNAEMNRSKTDANKSLFFVRNILWLHLSEWGKQRIKQRYPSATNPIQKRVNLDLVKGTDEFLRKQGAPSSPFKANDRGEDSEL